MAVRVTEARKAKVAALSHTKRGWQAPVPADGVREAFFASLTRELRCSLDGEERLQHVDGAWASVLDWEPAELHGWQWEELVHPADRARAAKTLARLRARGGLERDVELRLALPDGGHRLTSWTFLASPTPGSVLALGRAEAPAPPDEDGARRAVARLEEENERLAARVAELEERYTAVERFAGTAAHQLAEPLVIAESSAILVVDELGPDLDPQLRDRLDAIGRGAARARLLIDALLQDARSAGRPIRLARVDVGTVVEAAIATLSPRFEARGITPVVTPHPTLLSDPRLLGVIYENLLSNALKYGPREGSEIRVHAAREGDMWRLSVTSPGTPLPDADRERIFEPFRRAAGERRAPGTGLGLAICARLAERLGGRMDVEPQADGNTFFVTLPA
jgi:signal transduction histidine kinase